MVVVSEGVQAVKLCTNRILQFVSWGCQLMQVELYNGRKMVVVIVVVPVPYWTVLLMPLSFSSCLLVH